MKAWFLHGAVGHPSDWDPLIAAVGMGSSAPDLYGEGVVPPDRFAVRLCASAARGDALVGYSMGGRLALHALVQPGAPWSRAVIISADPGAGPDPARVSADREWADLARRDWPAFLRQWAAQPVFGGAPMPWRRPFGAGRREAVARGFEEWSVGKQRDLRPEIGRCGIPVRWIAGARDEKFVRLASGVPGVDVAVVENAGHRVPWEQPEVTAELIRSFLS